MSWGIVAGSAVAAVGSAYAANQAGKASERAAETSAEAQMAGLEYLKEQEKLPIYYRDQALGMLAGEYGLSPYGSETGGTTYTQERNPVYDELTARLEQARARNYHPKAGGSARSQREVDAILGQLEGVPEFIDSAEVGASGVPVQSVSGMARQSPLYEAMMASRGAGEESIARNAAVTGRLRGGATIDDLTQYNTDLENQAFLNSYQNIMGGLSSLAGAQGYAPQIAQQYSNIGQTQAAGQLGKAQAMQEGYSGIASALGSGAEAYFNRNQGTV